MINRKALAGLTITILLLGFCAPATAQNESWKRISAGGKRNDKKRRSTVTAPPDSSRNAKALNQQVERIEKQTRRSRATTKDGSRTAAATSNHHKLYAEKADRNQSMNFQAKGSHSAPRGHKSASSHSKVGNVGLKR
jgi:hypothetical protein